MLNKKSISILQISLMVIAIFAFAFILDGAFVSATENLTPPENPSSGGPGYSQNFYSPETNERSNKILERAGEAVLSVAVTEGARAGIKALGKKTVAEGSKIAFQSTPAWEATKPLASTAGETSTKTGLFAKLGISKGGGGLTIFGSILSLAAITAAAFAMGRYVIGPLTGLDLSGSQALGWALAGGTAAGIGAGASSFGAIPLLGMGLWAGLGIGAAVALIIFALVYKKTPVEVVQYNCLAWQPQKGGEFCDECNNGELPCTEYQCRSLGSACEIVNKGTGEEICFFANRTDVKAPIIEVNKPEYDSNIRFEAYGDTRFPEDRGVNLVNTNTKSGCYAPYDEIKIAIALDEPGICKYSFFRDRSYDEMPSVYLSNGLAKYNHSTSFNMPGRAEIEAENLTFFEGLNQVFIRCEDYGNGNQNIANYVFDFCVDESPDLTEPVILGTNPLTDSYIAFNTSSIDSTFYIDKPAECRWDHFDMSFDQMQNSMTCATSIGDGINLNQRLVYPCETTLTGLQNYVPNDFYISCKSYPNKEEVERMEMGQSYKYTLIGTRPLAIDSVAPDNETMRGSAEIVTVNLEATTIEGAEKDGTATCFYDLSNSGNNVEFFETDSYRHIQELFLGAGNYNIKITCVDAGGNIAIDYANFRIEVDKQAPIITRAYYENNRIVLVTNEESTCVYNTNTCDQSYDDSIKISSSDSINHYLAWDTEQNLYLKCEDQYGNRPMPKECSMVVRGHELFSLTN